MLKICFELRNVAELFTLLPSLMAAFFLSNCLHNARNAVLDNIFFFFNFLEEDTPRPLYALAPAVLFDYNLIGISRYPIRPV